MAFRFTTEDFQRYVKQEEHGGRHIWHELEAQLKAIYGVPFSTAPYIARGDRLQTFWIAPKGTPRSKWANQAQFFVSRNIEKKRLSFGLEIECLPASQTTEFGLDPDRDGMRLIKLLEMNPEFSQKLDQLRNSPQWQIWLSVWNKGEYQPKNNADLLQMIKELPEEQGWSVEIQQVLSAEETIDLGEGIIDRIMEAYQVIRPLWETVIPEADREALGDAVMTSFTGSARDSEEHAKQILESLLPDPEIRRICLELVADYIIQAHKLSPATWGITLFSNRVRLNIGSIQTFVIQHDVVYLVLDDESLDTTDRTLLEQQGKTHLENYTTVPTTYDIELVAHKLPTILQTVKKGYPTLVQRAFKGAKRTPYYRSHSPGVIKYLRSFLGRAIPDPNYGNYISEPERLSPPFDLKTVLNQSLISQSLYFTPWQIATFYTALQTKGFVILSGISGTGKTKLAQAFAEALPQPAQSEVSLTDDVIAVTVQPYMRKYGRLIVPKQATRLFDPPPPGESQDVTLKFDNTSQVCRFVHASYANTDYLSLMFRGKARQWFLNTFAEGDTIVLQPELSQEDMLAGFQIGTPDTIATQTPTKPEGGGQRNVLFVPVRTDWRDSKSLLGYYNPLTGTYEWTPFLRFLLRAVQSYRARDGLAWFIILDEMNLARVEYYFADLLSVLESGRTTEGWTREPLRLSYPDTAEGDLPPKELLLPSNLYVVGTVNVDETTHAFSPKVLDRAFTLELTDADFSRYPASTATSATTLDDTQRHVLLKTFTTDGVFTHIDKTEIATYIAGHPDVREHLRALNALLRPYDMHFGYRVFDEIVAFLLNAERNGLYDTLSGDDPAFDAAVLMKVLPKFHGSRGKLEQPLKQVLAWCLDLDAPAEETIADTFKNLESSDDVAQKLANLNYRYPHTAARVQRMLWALYTSGFAAFG